jgi:hypothetical protein
LVNSNGTLYVNAAVAIRSMVTTRIFLLVGNKSAVPSIHFASFVMRKNNYHGGTNIDRYPSIIVAVVIKNNNKLNDVVIRLLNLFKQECVTNV